MRIGSKEFKNKKEALNYYKEILNSYKFGETLNDKDKQDIIDLLSIRPDFETKFCNGFKQIYVDKIPKYKYRLHKQYSPISTKSHCPICLYASALTTVDIKMTLGHFICTVGIITFEQRLN
jgi:hypothetical protein